MGFSAQQYGVSSVGGVGGPTSGGGGGSTRRMVNNVIHSLANSAAMAAIGAGGQNNHSQSLFGQFRSWQRSRRLRTVAKNAAAASSANFSVVNPMSNLCYQSMLPKSTTDVTKFTDADPNCYQMTPRAMTKKITPVVSFRNKGEGMIAMQLVNRVMLNENQLYSMHLSASSPSTKNSAASSETTLSNESCYSSLEPADHLLTSDNLAVSPSDPTLINEPWYYGTISREKAISAVVNCVTGTFLVRKSATKEDCFALTVRVPHDYNYAGVAHYLILHTAENRYKIKGFYKDFPSIQSLIIHHSIMKEQLPCTLRLLTVGNSITTAYSNATNVHKSISCMHLNNKQQQQRKFSSPSSAYTLDHRQSPQSSAMQSNHYTYGRHQSCYALNVSSAINTNKNNDTADDDLMVDVDLDPTYQKILDNFRKVMAHCS